MESRIAVCAGVLAAALLSGCVSHPLTAQAFREAVPGSLSARVEQLEVERPFRDVAGTFRKKAPECLQVSVRTTSQTHQSYQVYTTTYKPTVVEGQDRVELHLQQHVDNTLKVSEEPDGGYYLLVADAYPVDSNKTRLVLYRPALGYKVLVKAIVGWASGEDLGCPDMTRI